MSRTTNLGEVGEFFTLDDIFLVGPKGIGGAMWSSLSRGHNSCNGMQKACM